MGGRRSTWPSTQNQPFGFASESVGWDAIHARCKTPAQAMDQWPQKVFEVDLLTCSVIREIRRHIALSTLVFGRRISPITLSLLLFYASFSCLDIDGRKTRSLSETRPG